MEFINLTPHELNVQREDGSLLNIPASGTVARVGQKETVVDTLEGINITQQVFDGDVTGVPEPQGPFTYYIVSRIVASALAEADRTNDILVPGPAVRDDSGKIIGCRGFSQL